MRLRSVAPGATGVAGIVALAAGVFVLGTVAVALRPDGAPVAAWWPAVGLSSAWVLMAPRGQRALLLVTVAVSAVAANLAGGRPPLVALCYGLVNVAETAAVAVALTPRDGERPRLRGLGHVGGFLGALLLGSAIAGIGAGMTGWLLLDAPLLETGAKVLVSHGAAMLLVLPLVLVRREVRARRASRVELVAQWLSLIAVTGYLFSPGQDLPLTFLPVPFLLWCAVRSGPRVLACQMMAVAVMATGLTTLGAGPFAASGLSDAVSVALVQLFIAVYATMLLVLALAVDRREEAAEVVAAREALYRGGFQDALLGMLLVRFDGERVRVIELNDVAVRLLQHERDDLVGAAWCRYVAPEHLPDVEHGVLSVLADEVEGWHGEVQMQLPGGRRWMEVALARSGETVETGADGDQPVLSVQMIDVTERREAHEHLVALSVHDQLTGLPNRMLLLDRLGQALARSHHTQAPVTVTFVDLDGFKAVNDVEGHRVGDEVLVETARLLREAVRPSDTVARLGGDEFVVVTDGPTSAAQLAGWVRRIESALDRRMVVDGREHRLGGSVGFAVSHAASTPENLLHEADSRMYAEKRRRRAERDRLGV